MKAGSVWWAASLLPVAFISTVAFIAQPNLHVLTGGSSLPGTALRPENIRLRFKLNLCCLMRSVAMKGARIGPRRPRSVPRTRASGLNGLRNLSAPAGYRFEGAAGRSESATLQGELEAAGLGRKPNALQAAARQGTLPYGRVTKAAGVNPLAKFRLTSSSPVMCMIVRRHVRFVCLFRCMCACQCMCVLAAHGTAMATAKVPGVQPKDVMRAAPQRRRRQLIGE
jgi:hypothetical protein